MKLFLFIVIFTTSTFCLCQCAPKISSASGSGNYRNSLYKTEIQPLDDQFQETLLSEINAGLDLVKLLPSEVLHRKLKEAIVVVGQTLQTPNPLLRSAINLALKQVKVKANSQQPPAPTLKLQAFLYNLKQIVNGPNFEFPKQFKHWITHQIEIVETTVAKNSSGLSRLAEESDNPWSPKAVSSFLKKQVDEFTTFLVRGLEILENQEELKIFPEVSMLKEAVEKGKYDRFATSIVWGMIAEDYDESAIDFKTALEELHRRATPELQPLPKAVLKAVHIRSQSLDVEEVDPFFENLGQWNTLTT